MVTSGNKGSGVTLGNKGSGVTSGNKGSGVTSEKKDRFIVEEVTCCFVKKRGQILSSMKIINFKNRSDSVNKGPATAKKRTSPGKLLQKYELVEYLQPSPQSPCLE